MTISMNGIGYDKSDIRNEGKHDYSGAWSPYIDGYKYRFLTFSVGIFKLVKKSSGNGLKKSKVKYRVHGNSYDPEKVYKRATEICKLMDSGDFNLSKKSETV